MVNEKRVITSLGIITTFALVPYLVGYGIVRIPNAMFLSTKEFSYWFLPYWGAGILTLAFLVVPLILALGIFTWLVIDWAKWITTKDGWF